MARQLWESVYPDIARDRYGLFGALTSRAAPQIMRLSLIYALLDGSSRKSARRICGPGSSADAMPSSSPLRLSRPHR